MKSDKLEKFILDNRDDFDDMVPSPGGWDRVKENIRPPRAINWTNTLVRIAAAVVIFVASYIFIDYNINRDQVNGQMVSEEDLYEHIPVLVEARAYYSSQIQTMEQEVYKLTGNDSPIRNDIQAEFEELDKVFEELKADLNDNAANQEVVEAMIQNYRLKLQILEEILYQLKNAGKNSDKDEEKRTVL
jgi:hypothetical protein